MNLTNGKQTQRVSPQLAGFRFVTLALLALVVLYLTPKASAWLERRNSASTVDAQSSLTATNAQDISAPQVVVFTENFDGVTAPNLPAGWTTQLITGQAGDPAWTTTASVRDTLPNSATTNDPAHTTDKVLTSPSIAIPAQPCILTFRNNYNLESGFDGGALEISINGGTFQDVISAGGLFTAGGYNGTLFNGPLFGRSVWTGTSGGFITTGVKLPSSAQGQSIRLRWHVTSDNIIGGVGQFVDTVAINTIPIISVINTNDAGAGSYRQALLTSNSTPGYDAIHFNIPGSGVRTITPLSPFPDITDPVLIDATTQPGYAGTPIIELNGVTVTNQAAGVTVGAGRTTVRGFIINRFHTGININTGSENMVEGNYIGVDATGNVGIGNIFMGISISGGSNNNIIGGTTSTTRNIISGNGTAGSPGNGFEGIRVFNSSGNRVMGNYIGTNAAGTAAIPNTGSGILLGFGGTPATASNNIIGGTEPGAGNLISGNTSSGIHITDSTSQNNQVFGNFIGTNAAGTAAIGNHHIGVFIAGGTSHNIGDNLAGARNVISGNGASGLGYEGVRVNASGNVISGNYIGTNAAGNAAIPNLGDGINLGFGGAASDNFISANLVSANAFNGVKIEGNGSFSNSLVANLIGTEATGSAALGNTFQGVLIDEAPDNNVGFNGFEGGQSPTGGSSPNVIAFNGAAGVNIRGAGAVNNGVESNSIHSNGGLGIDLGDNGLTLNDNGDGDTGPNNLQNFPVLTLASLTGTTLSITGTINSTPNTELVIEFFSNSACDSSGNGEGATLIRIIGVTTDASGNAVINTSFTSSAAIGQFVTATAESAGTSEFSTCRLITTPTVQFSSSVYSNPENVSPASIAVTRTNGSAGAASVQYATVAGGTAVGGASCTPGVDYVNTSGTLNWVDGDATNKSFPITICNDATLEAGDTINLQLSNPVGTSLGTPSTATLTITNDDPQPSISITDVTQTEGNAGTSNFAFTVSLSAASALTTTVQYATANGTATAGSDYIGIGTTTLTFNPGVTSQQVNATVNGDTLDENNETFVVNLSNPTNATISDNQGQGTITDDDAPPSISIVDVTQTEGNGGSANFNFTVNLSAASGLTVTVNYVTADNTANSGSDYQQTGPATLTFSPGEISKTIAVAVNGDTFDETNETFFVNLSTPGNATISDNQALGTINDDDLPPTINITDVSQPEGNSGTTNFNFIVSLSAASSFTVTVNYGTADGSASSGSDYQQAGPATLTFNPGQTSRTITVAVNGDTANELHETFVVNLSTPTNATIADGQGQGTITNDDSSPSLSINDVSVNEGNAGTTNAVFLVTLSAASGVPVSVNYASSNGSAIAGSDYNAVASNLTFNPGETSKSISVPIIGDTTGEPNENFFITLSSANNATIADNQGVGTIVNDDQGSGSLKIGGRVVDIAGVAIAGIAVNLGGDLSLTVNTDGSGNYQFMNLNPGNYNVSPASGFYTFSPPTRTANPLSVNRVFNFVGSRSVVSIAGHVADLTGVPLPNTSIRLLTNGVQTHSIVSDALGNYVFAGLVSGANYIVEPAGSFRPSSQTFNALTVEATANFQVSPPVPSECGSVSFVKTDLTVGSAPQGIVSADFNADGKSDLAVANFLSNNVSILLATGPGTFGAPTQFAAGLNPISIGQGDFNADGRPDLVVTNFNSSSVSVLLATGPGTFGSAASLSVGTRPRSIVVADLNNDGKVDLATANQSSNNVSVLLGNGTGGFGSATNVVVGIVPLFVAAADFNNDGFKDLVTADAGSNAVSLLLGTGGGNFATGVGFPAGVSPFAIAVGDFNHDSRSDLAVANNDSPGGLTTISILLASPSGGFGAPASVTVGTNPSFIATADFNGDGHLDLSVANGGSNDVSMLLGTGVGGFVLTTNIPVGTSPRALAVGDFDVDGKSDLVVGNFTSNNISLLLNRATLCNTQTSLKISGKTSDYNGNAIPGVTLTLSGPVSRVIQSDANGNYSFNNLVPGGNYAVKAQSPHYVFAPSRADFFNLSGSHILNLRAAPFVVPEPAPPIDDEFDTPGRDPNKWTFGTLSLPASALDPAVTVVQRNGLLEITPLNQRAGLHYNGYVSVNSIDIRGGPISVEVPRAATGGAETIYAIGSDTNNFFRFLVRTAGPATASQAEMYRGPDGIEWALDTTTPQLLLQIMIDGNLTTIPGFVYNQQQHQHMRFRYEPPFVSPQFGAVVFETSPDNASWTVLHRALLTRTVNPMTVELTAGTQSPVTGESSLFQSVRRVLTTVQFSSANYQVNEAQQSIEITVTRTGDTTTPASVDYETADGTASQLNRYTQATGTLDFPIGIMNQSFQVLINNNVITDGDQFVNLILAANPSGPELNSPSRATLNIIDDDTVVPTSNNLDDPVFFVTQHYSDFLSRQPEPSGLNFWVEQITSCPPGNQACVNARRIRVSHAFFFEQEFQQTGAFVFRLYRAAYGNHQPFPNPFPHDEHPGEAEKTPSYAVFSSDRAQVVGGAQLTSTQLALANNFVQRPQFVAKYPANLDGPAFITALLNTIQTATGENLSSQQQVLQTLHTQGGRGLVMFHIANDYWNNCDRLPGNPPAPCVPAGVGPAVDNRPFIDEEYRRVFVTTQYYGYLRRDADIGGLVFWLGQVNRFPLRDLNIQNAMVCSFITSEEYQLRFSPIITHGNHECQQ